MAQHDDLMQALGFTSDDLSCNRDGNLSDSQREKLRRMRRRALLLGGGIVVLLIFVATGFLFVGQQNESPIMTLVGIGLVMCNVVIMGVFTRYWLRLDADLRAGKVCSASGRAERVLRVTRGQRVSSYVLKIGEERFPTTRDMLKFFEHEQPYRAYYSPYARVLLSTEPL
jgi:hypothetical protein